MLETIQSDQLPGSNVRTTYGYAAESLPLVDTISPVLRQNILASKDINLASLLIPYYAYDNSESRPDPRLNRSLTLAEFIQAFGVYKNIMTSAHPRRRNELDLYERDFVDMATRYKHNNIKVDWSVRNKSLFL